MNSSPPIHSGDDVPRPGSTLYYALNAVPTSQRKALLLWTRWWHEISQIPLKVSDPGVAETKLRWWQQEIRDAAQGQPHHPLTTALLERGTVANGVKLPDWPLWTQQLEGLLTLVHQTRWLDDGSLQRHAQQTTGSACEGAACLLGASSDAARQAARLLGWGVRQAHQFARLGQDARAGWIQVPIDVLQAHNVRAHQLSKPDSSQTPEGLAGLLSHLHKQASGHIRQGLTACRALPAKEARALQALCVLAHIHLALIDEVARQGERVLYERIVLTPLRKWWIAQRVKWGLLR